MTELMDNEMLPANLINYVIRVKQPLILNQPANIPEYSHSRYFEKNRPRSVICHPVLKHGELFGVLYLENEHHEGLFDEKKVNLLNLISAQIAVSLDNAFLYQHLETRVQERTEAIELEKGKESCRLGLALRVADAIGLVLDVDAGATPSRTRVRSRQP